MKINRITSRIAITAAVAAAFVFSTPTIQATPYASSLTNNAGVISFRLNEKADAVAVIFTNLNGTLVTSNLGPKLVGLTVTNLSVPGSYTIMVTNSAAPGYISGATLQISNDSTNGTVTTGGVSTNTLRFNAPRGVALNLNPASINFGRIYVANAVAGTATRSVGDGIYVLNADFSDAVGQGNTARTAGITVGGGVIPFTNAIAGSTDDGNTPFRLEVGQDNNLYISDFSLTNGTIYVTDPSVVTGTNVLAGFGAPGAPNSSTNHGRIGSSVIATGSLANGNLTLYALDTDATNTMSAGVPDGAGNLIMQWNIGSATLPVDLVVTNMDDRTLLPNPGITEDLDRGPDGKFYLLQNRSAGGEGGIFVIDPAVDGSPFYPTPDGLWDEVYDSRADSVGTFGASSDLLLQSRAVKISPDGKYMAVVRDDNQFWIIPLVNGLPNLATRKLIANGSTTTIGRDIAFDAAGNVYVTSSGQALLRVFSPGYKSITATSSQGTFAFTNILPATTVTLSTTVASATENISDPKGSNSPAIFTFTRDGDVSQALTVNYTIAGTATRGLDYATNGLSGLFPAINGVITFAAGDAATNVYIAVQDDNFGEATETVIFNVSASTNYISGGTGTATVSILDDGDLPAVSITNLGGSYELLPGRPAKFKLSMPIAYISDLIVNIGLTGTAVSGVDYTNASSFTVLIKQGIVSTNFTVTPYGNSLTNSKTIIATILVGTGYTNDVIFSATNILRPDYLPPTTPMFSDSFDTDTSANWVTKLFSGTNSDATFNYDYSGIGVPPAPHTTNGTTRGLRLRARLGGTANANEGVSVTPVGKNFTNDFRLRYDLWMNYNGPLPGGGAGSSEYFTTGLGVSETRTNISTVAALPGSSIIFSVDGDGGFAEATGDYIVYSNGVALTATGTNIYLAGARDNFSGYYAEFGELPAPALQVTTYPGPTAGANQTGLGTIGTLSFAWHDVVITKIGTIYSWTIDGLPIASINYGNPTVGTNFSLGYQDINSSAMDNILVNNAIVDNVIVESLISTNALLAGLIISSGTYSPVFAAGITNYSVTNAFASNPVTVTATRAGSAASLRLSLNGGSFIPLTNGLASLPQTLLLNPSTNILTVRVVSEDGNNTNFYNINVKLLPSQTVPVLTNSFNGFALTLSWATDHVGYRLQSQTNTLSVGLGTNWFPISSSEFTNQVIMPVNSTNPTVFYRLIYP